MKLRTWSARRTVAFALGITLPAALVMAPAAAVEPQQSTTGIEIVDLAGWGIGEAVAVSPGGIVVGEWQSEAFAYDLVTGVWTDLGVLEGDSTSAAIAVNDGGLVVGTSSAGWGQSTAFAYDLSLGAAAQMVDLGPLFGDLGPNSGAIAVNDSGVIVGWVGQSQWGGGGDAFALTYGPDVSAADLVILDLGDASTAVALDVNEAGRVVGWVDNDAFIDDLADGAPGLRLTAQSPDWWVMATAVNDTGVVAGHSDLAAYLLHDGTGPLMRDLGDIVEGEVLYDAPLVEGVNDDGVIVGNAYTATQSVSRAFVYDLRDGADAVMRNLGTLGTGDHSFANGVSEAGVVAGFSSTVAGSFVGTHAFAYDLRDGTAAAMVDLGALSEGGSSYGKAVTEVAGLGGRTVVVGDSGGRPVAWIVGEPIAPPATVTIDRILVKKDQATVTFSLTGDPPVVTCQLDEEAAAPCLSPHTFTGVTAGSHTVTVAAGQVSDSEIFFIGKAPKPPKPPKPPKDIT